MKKLSILFLISCLASCTPPASPTAKLSDTPGFVLNPFTGNKLDVRHASAGDLVMDPNTGDKFIVPRGFQSVRPSSQMGNEMSSPQLKTINISGVKYEIIAERKGMNPLVSGGAEYTYKLVKNRRLEGYEYAAELSKEEFMTGSFLTQDWTTAHNGGILVFLDAKPIAKEVQREKAGKFVKNPWTGKVMEVTGLPSGRVAKDPTDPNSLYGFVLP